MPLTQQIARYQGLALPLVPELGRCTMTVREILALAPGSLITLSRAVGSKIEVRVGGAPFGLGELVSVGKVLSLRFSSFHGDESQSKVDKNRGLDGA